MSDHKQDQSDKEVTVVNEQQETEIRVRISNCGACALTFEPYVDC